MLSRVLLLLAGASLTMGAVVAPPGTAAAFVPVDRAPAATELARITRAAEAGPAAVRRAAAEAPALAAASPEPRRVASWWRGLAPRIRAVLVAGAPHVVGDLEGLPYGVRDRANRTVLAAATASAEGRLRTAGTTGHGEALAVAERLATLRQVATALQRPAGGPPRFLVSLDPTSASRAAVAVGDVATADDVAFLVPGMYFSVRQQIVDWTRTAADVQAEETAWLRRLHDHRTAAVVSWIGYRTPYALNVTDTAAAEECANRLTAAVGGLAAARPGRGPYTSVLAHSYGATASVLALTAHAFSLDALAMVGSPGGSATSATQLAVPAGRVFVGVAAWDGVATSGFFGTEPAAAGFGARPLGASGGVDPITGERLAPALGHNGYLVPGTESLRNIALVAAGHTDLVTGGPAPRSTSPR